MAIINQFNIGIKMPPQVPQGTQVSLSITPQPLMFRGLNLPVEISTASAFRQPPNPLPLTSIVVLAHFDTGASITSIDLSLAKHLGLNPTGQAISHTAAGAQNTPTFAVDISFPNTNLTPFQNLQIGSCQLPFNLQLALKGSGNAQNFGLLIGRDIMSRWNIIWNGPSSSVTISD
ncbi:MAG TPA: retropepsin-like aspartic protease [bacterium]|nr:retropepsin-like aspartic protease [bacterium]HPS30679.1 retropepsin-like aspartic protease [bacterium]